MSLFVAVGHNGQRVVSDNGVDWKNLQVGKEGEVYRDAAFGAGVLVAVGNFGGSNLFASTRDGAAWKAIAKDGQYKYFLRAVAFGDGAFLGIGGDPGAVGSSAPFVVRSTDGDTWTDYIPIAGKNIIRRIAWGNGTYVAVGGDWLNAVDPPLAYTSQDGLDWTVHVLDSDYVLTGVSFGNGRFVATRYDHSDTHEHIFTSPDGVRWQRQSVPQSFLGVLMDITYGNGWFVATSRNGGGILASPDGLNWTVSDQEGGNYDLHDVTSGGGKFVAVGASGVVLQSVLFQPPRFESVRQKQGGAFEISISAVQGAVVEIEGSSDLKGWTLLSTVTNSTGQVTYTLPNESEARFLRASLRGR
jgi:hypothetical protein